MNDNLSVNQLIAKKNIVLSASRAIETNKALQKNWQLFEKWCVNNNIVNFPAQLEVYEAFFIHLLDLSWKRSSIDQAKWALVIWHENRNLIAPLGTNSFKQFLNGIHRIIGFQQTQKREITIDHIKQMHFKADLMGNRDKLLLLIGFGGGFRRSELINLNVADVAVSSLGMRIQIRKSKTNQFGATEFVDLPMAKDINYCPSAHYLNWIKCANIENGPIFRSFHRGGKISNRTLSCHHVAIITKKYISTIGFNPVHYSAHSLRAGCATFLLQKNVPLNIVSKQLRHKKVDTTLKYDRNLVHNAIKDLY